MIKRLFIIMCFIFSTSAYAIEDQVVLSDIQKHIDLIKAEPDINKRLDIFNDFGADFVDKYLESILPRDSVNSNAAYHLPENDPRYYEFASRVYTAKLFSDIYFEKGKVTAPRCREEKRGLAETQGISVLQISARRTSQEVIIAYNFINAICYGVM